MICLREIKYTQELTHCLHFISDKICMLVIMYRKYLVKRKAFICMIENKTLFHA